MLYLSFTQGLDLFLKSIKQAALTVNHHNVRKSILLLFTFSVKQDFKSLY